MDVLQHRPSDQKSSFSRREGEQLATSAKVAHTAPRSWSGATKVISTWEAFRSLISSLHQQSADSKSAQPRYREHASLAQTVNKLMPLVSADEGCVAAFERFVGKRCDEADSWHSRNLACSADWQAERQGSHLASAR